MYLVVGLGNPGREYEATRHNMGFDTIDHLVEDYNVPQGGVKFNAMYGKTMIGGEKVILMKPLSFMNLSGGPVREMANYFKIDPETELIVIYDDIDLEPGQHSRTYIHWKTVPGNLPSGHVSPEALTPVHKYAPHLSGHCAMPLPQCSRSQMLSCCQIHRSLPPRSLPFS